MPTGFAALGRCVESRFLEKCQATAGGGIDLMCERIAAEVEKSGEHMRERIAAVQLKKEVLNRAVSEKMGAIKEKVADSVHLGAGGGAGDQAQGQGGASAAVESGSGAAGGSSGGLTGQV